MRLEEMPRCEFSFGLPELMLTIPATEMNALPTTRFRLQRLCLLTAALTVTTGFAAEGNPPASPEITAAIQPYLDSYKLAGIAGIIAGRTGKIHYQNLLGYADVETKKLHQRR
jgi:hypothetical protein